MPSNQTWYASTFGNNAFVAVANGVTASAYAPFLTLPVAYGIYNGATVRA